VTDSTTSGETGKEPEGLPNDAAITIFRAVINRLFELTIEEIDRDLAKVNTLELFDQLVVRARWTKMVDLLLAASRSIDKYKTPKGELEVMAQVFGSQLGFPAQTFPADVGARLEWYKKRVAKEYEERVKTDVNLHDITSPIEQIFLMEWRFLKIDEQHGVKIQPQKQLTLDGISYAIDFIVESPDGRVKLAIELDGHDFHERTKEQAAYDRARERKLVRHGHTIFRFTGSEIVRNPRGCVDEVVGLLAVPR